MSLFVLTPLSGEGGLLSKKKKGLRKGAQDREIKKGARYWPRRRRAKISRKKISRDTDNPQTRSNTKLDTTFGQDIEYEFSSKN